MVYAIPLIQIKDKEIAAAVLYNLQAKLEQMESQLGYIKTLDRETIKVWQGGNSIEVNRLEWVSNTEADIVICKKHIAEMEAIAAESSGQMAEDLNGKYVRQDVFDEIMKRVEDRFVTIDGKLDDIQDVLKKNGNGKINIKYILIIAAVALGSGGTGWAAVKQILEALSK